MADHHIQFGAASAVHGSIASGADHAVTMHEPHPAGFRVTRDWETAGETDLRRIDIAVGQAGERQLRLERALELRW